MIKYNFKIIHREITSGTYFAKKSIADRNLKTG